MCQALELQRGAGLGGDSCNTGDGVEKEHLLTWGLEMHTGQARRCWEQNGARFKQREQRPGTLDH